VNNQLPRWIYHIATESDLTSFCDHPSYYEPSAFVTDGFIHGALDLDTVFGVAESYYAEQLNPLVVLRIEVCEVDAIIKLEAPIPKDGKPQAHHKPGRLFPHIYGFLPLSAIDGGALLHCVGGEWKLEGHWEPLALVFERLGLKGLL